MTKNYSFASKVLLTSCYQLNARPLNKSNIRLRKTSQLIKLYFYGICTKRAMESTILGHTIEGT